jgi:hypothetical protein
MNAITASAFMQQNATVLQSVTIDLVSDQMTNSINDQFFGGLTRYMMDNAANMQMHTMLSAIHNATNSFGSAWWCLPSGIMTGTMVSRLLIAQFISGPLRTIVMLFSVRMKW